MRARLSLQTPQKNVWRKKFHRPSPTERNIQPLRSVRLRPVTEKKTFGRGNSGVVDMAR
jgi:hypothetical protein